MLRNYVKTALRNLRMNPLLAGVNNAGLSAYLPLPHRRLHLERVDRQRGRPCGSRIKIYGSTQL